MCVWQRCWNWPKNDRTRIKWQDLYCLLGIPLWFRGTLWFGKRSGCISSITALPISVGPTDQTSCLSSKLSALVSLPRRIKNRLANNNISGSSNIRQLTADELFMRNLIRHLCSRLQEKDGTLAWSHIINLELVSTRRCFAAEIIRGPEVFGRRPLDPETRWTHDRIWLPSQLIHLLAKV